jgi:hypothetical protein
MIDSDSFTVFFACVNFEELAAIGLVPVQVFKRYRGAGRVSFSGNALSSSSISIFNQLPLSCRESSAGVDERSTFVVSKHGS